MKKTSRKYIILFAAVLALAIVAMSVPATLAYFSDQDRANGAKDVKLGWETELHEYVEENSKHIAVENVGDTDAIVRVAVFAGDFASVNTGSDWKLKNGWYYYDKVLKAGETTPELFVSVKAEASKQADFNIVVVHESSRVVYSDNETLKVPDGWDFAPEV